MEAGTSSAQDAAIKGLQEPRSRPMAGGRWTSLWRRPVSTAMRMPWPVVLLAMTLIDLAEVAMFALALPLDPGPAEVDGPLSPGLGLRRSGLRGRPRPIA
jgi:hypothetical protein